MRKLAQLARDGQGGALVEFALVMPFMILLLVGSVELVGAYSAQRKVYHVAYAVADIVSQASTQQPLTNAGLADVMSAGQTLMTPLAADGSVLTIKVASFTEAADGKSMSNDWTYPAGATITPPATLQAGQSVVVGEADYTYTPFSSYVWAPGATLTFRRQALLQPRYLASVPKPTS